MLELLIIRKHNKPPTSQGRGPHPNVEVMHLHALGRAAKVAQLEMGTIATKKLILTEMESDSRNMESQMKNSIGTLVKRSVGRSNATIGERIMKVNLKCISAGRLTLAPTLAPTGFSTRISYLTRKEKHLLYNHRG